MRQSLQELIDSADTAGLLLAVDGLCATRDWDGLCELAARCRDAIERGLQLWPVALHVDYRLALEAPAPHAGRVLTPGTGRFTLGPLTEVAAHRFDWAALRPHLTDPATANAVAQERVIRGEHLPNPDQPADSLLAAVELPLAPGQWEAAYALPNYRDRSAEFPLPHGLPTVPAAQRLQPAPLLGSDEATRALLDVVESWSSQSSGRAHAVTVEGTAAGAVAHLAPAAGLAPLRPSQAAALLQWAGASGGAHGPRRGGAAGRFATWWAITALTGLQWPPDPADVAAAITELEWFRWWPSQGETGWVLRLAVADPVDGLAWAIDATDQLDDGDDGTDELTA